MAIKTMPQGTTVSWDGSPCGDDTLGLPWIVEKGMEMEVEQSVFSLALVSINENYDYGKSLMWVSSFYRPRGRDQLGQYLSCQTAQVIIHLFREGGDLGVDLYQDCPHLPGQQG